MEARASVRSLQSRLSVTLDAAKVALELQERLEAQYKAIRLKLAEAKQDEEELRGCINHMVDIYRHVQSYINAKKNGLVDTINNVIDTTSHIVPDSELDNLELFFEGGNAVIRDKKTNASVFKIEGGAARYTLGILLTLTTICNVPGALKLIVCDEVAAPLQTENALVFAPTMKLLAEDMYVIGIEQRSYIWAQIANRTYNFHKAGGRTIVT